MGGTIFVFENSRITIFNSNFLNNYANYGGVIFLQENANFYSHLISCAFINNSGLNNIIDFQNTYLTINDSSFTNNKNLLCSATFSVITMINVTIINQYCYLKIIGCLIESDGSSIILEDSHIENITNLFSNDIFYLENTYFSMNSSFMDNITSCFSVYSSQLKILSTTFQNYEQNCIFSKKNSIITIRESNFSNENFHFNDNDEKIKNFGAIYCEDFLEVEITGTSFSYNQNILIGSAIHLTHTITFNESSNAIIANSYFYHNYALDLAGAIYIYDQNSSIINNSFSNNVAARGGAIYIENLLTNTLVRNNKFMTNIAKIEGGAIKWSENKPIIEEDNVFINNSAIYGKDIASYPIRMIVEFYNKTNSDKDVSATKFTNNNLVLENIVTGVEIPYDLTIKIVDSYNKIVNLDGGFVEIMFHEDLNNSNQTKNELIIKGENPQMIYKGASTIQNLKMNYPPNSNITVKIQSTDILKYQSSLINETLPYELNANGKYFALVQINFRKCKIGEVFIDQIHMYFTIFINLDFFFRCSECSEGEYSFEDGMLVTNCKKCPKNALNCYGDKIYVREGFWRSGIYKEKIYDCESFKERCMFIFLLFI